MNLLNCEIDLGQLDQRSVIGNIAINTVLKNKHSIYNILLNNFNQEKNDKLDNNNNFDIWNKCESFPKSSVR